jgi:hypothetical protein
VLMRFLMVETQLGKVRSDSSANIRDATLTQALDPLM